MSTLPLPFPLLPSLSFETPSLFFFFKAVSQDPTFPLYNLFWRDRGRSTVIRATCFDATGAGAEGMVFAGEEVVYVAAQLDVVVGELAELAVVEAGVLLSGAGAQGEAGDQVHEE